jgi:hypothetical protein
MKIILEPVSGTTEENLDRAKAEVNRVLNFRGSVTGVKAEGTTIIVEFEINPKWDLLMSEKVKSLKVWIPAKVRTVFKVLSVSVGAHE